MKIESLSSEFETLQSYVMRDNKEKIENINLDKESKFARCWLVRNTRKDKRIIYGSIIRGSKEVIISLEYMLMMKITLLVHIYELDVLDRKLKTSVEIYKLDDIEFNKEYETEINELIILYKRDK